MKIVTSELYLSNNIVRTKELTNLADAITFINNNITGSCLFDIYFDINNDECPCWQKTFSLQACQNKQEVIDFITKLYENGFI